MKSQKSVKFSFCIILSVVTFTNVLVISCKKKEDEKTPTVVESQNKIPTVVSKTLTKILPTKADGGGDVIDIGSAALLAKGVCWSTKSNPTIDDRKTNELSPPTNFSSILKGLAPNTTYHLRAYATNTFGTAYGSDVVFSTPKEADGTVSDADGNVYHIVQIGTQQWLVENLKTTTYQNGDPIPYIGDDAAWGDARTGGLCMSNHSDVIAEKMALLYNWYALKDSRQIAPLGWHIPSETEWLTMINLLGGYGKAGGKLKEVGSYAWTNPNVGATNETGFSARGGGVRYQNGSFGRLNDFGNYWSITEKAGNKAYSVTFFAESAGMGGDGVWVRTEGMSVRCIKD